MTEKFAHWGSTATSFSCWATVQLTKFRNNENSEGKAEPMECMETFARRGAAEIGYALLLLISVIEACVRLVLAAILMPILALVLEDRGPDDPSVHVGHVTLAGFILSGLNILHTISALFTNICTKQVNYNTLFPCCEVLEESVTVYSPKCCAN